MKQLSIPTKIIQKKKLINKDIISTKYNFEKSGSNGFITIDPPVICFQGYEIKKLNIFKFKIRNCSNIDQRINILPPGTQLFSIKFDKVKNNFQKKGTMAPGMYQEVQVFFNPDSYQYYYDTIKIHTENDNLIVPIHAYPVIPNLREIFPRLIDFGVVDTFQEKSFYFPIQNKIPVDFEYEFSYIQENEDIIIEPIKGLLPQNSTTTIKIQFNPKQNITYSIQVELKVSQFDFEPMPIKIMGTGRKSGLKSLQKRPKSQKLEQLKQSLPKLETDIQNQSIKDQELNQSEEFIQDMENSKNQSKFNIKKVTNTSISKNEKETETFKKIVKRNTFFQETDQNKIIQEKNYLQRFNNVQQMEKDKDIRFFQCIGDQNLTQEQLQKNQNERNLFNQNLLDQMEYEATHRYQILKQQDVPIIDNSKQIYESTWDTFKNNEIKRRKLITTEFLRIATKLITRNRVQKRLLKIKDLLKDCKNRQQVKKLVKDDWLQAEYKGVGNKGYVQFDLEIDERNFQKLQFPFQLDTSNSISNFKFNIDNTIGFDEQLSIDLINYCDSEVMQYKSFNINPLYVYNTIENDRKMRTGAEEEYSIREQSGPLEDENALKVFYNDKIMEQFLKQFDYDQQQKLLLNPKIKSFFYSESITETSPEFNLIYSKIDYQDHLDLKYNSSIDMKIFKNEFLLRQPGIQSINQQLEIDYYFQQRLQLPFDAAFERNIHKCCPQSLPMPLKEDQFSDEDSDGEKPPQLEYEDFQSFLKNLEQNDNNMKDLREKGIQSFRDNIIQQINQNLLLDRDQYLYLMSTKTNDYNKMIKNNDLKLLII